MYLARFETGAGEWVQGLAELPSVRGLSEPACATWWQEIAARLVAACQSPETTIVRRVSVDRARGLRQTIAIVAPAAHEAEVRRTLAGLTRLERLLGGSIQLPLARPQHDAALTAHPPLRFATTELTFAAAGKPLAIDFHVGPALDDLLVDAALSGFPLTYQIQVRAQPPNLGAMRALRKNVLALESMGGVPGELIAWQTQIASRLPETVAVCEEFVATDREGIASVSAMLEDRFRQEYGRCRIDRLDPRFTPVTEDDGLVLGLHSHDMEPPTDTGVGGAAVTRAIRDRLLGWQPSARVLSLIRPLENDGGRGDLTEPDPPLTAMERQILAALPDPYGGDGGFGFVSYKRQDLPRISGIMKMVSTWGVPLWYDRGIPGGTEWDAVLEEKLERCRFVLLFASPAAIESKYVRREVKFADALDRPLVSVVLETTALQHGLRMLLSQYQMLDARTPDFAERLRAAVLRLRG